MTVIDPSTPLGTIVTEHPGLARRLEGLGLDYCCGGRRSLGDACADRGLDARDVATVLADAVEPAPPAEWATMAPEELVDHLEATHHAYLHDELPRLEALMAKVDGAHGARHPELSFVRATFEELVADLDPHLAKEERILFPAVRAQADRDAPALDLGGPVRVMLVEHDRAGELLARLRALTDGYVAPADGCASYRALYDGLAELEADTHLHVHKENNVLFPAVLERSRRGPDERAGGDVVGRGR
jgi:regulator of cell morphogenesis and NO signaling